MLSNLALMAEIIGSIAVIVSLGFVVFELRENTRSTRSSTASAAAAATSAWYSDIGDNEQSSGLFLRFIQDPDSLTAEHRYQASMKMHSLLIILQNSYYMKGKGTLDKEILSYISGAVLAVHNQPGWQWFWTQRKAMFVEEFQNYVDGLGNDGTLYSKAFYRQPEISTTRSK